MIFFRDLIYKAKNFFLVNKILSIIIILLILIQGGLLYLLWSQKSGNEIKIKDKEEKIDISTTNSIYLSDQENIIPEEKISFTPQFLFFGDLMLDREVKDWIDKKGIDYLFKNLVDEENRFFMDTDLIGLNLESAVTKNGEHYSPALINDFAVAPERVSELKKYGFNFLNLANNHIADQGSKGYEETKNNLTELGISFSGCPDRQVGECSFVEKEIGGIKTAMVGFSMVYGVFDEKKAGEIISELKSRNELVIVNIHWGVEYSKNFNKKQQQVGRDLIDAGADVIIGHHPHVIQGMEIYKNKPIFYSLGNFIFDQYFSEATQTGLAVGFNYSAIGTKFYLFPFTTIKGEAKFLTGEAKKKFFTDFFAVSDISVKDYKDDIMGGLVNIKK